MKISLIPFYKTHLNNNIFDPIKLNARDNVLEPYIKLKSYFESKNCILNTVDITPIKTADYIIFFDLNLRYILQAYFAKKLHKSIYISFEPPVVMPLHKDTNLKWISKIFGKVLIWQDDLVDNKKFFKFYFPVPNQNINYKQIEFKDKKFITTIVGYKKSNKKNELYSKRIEAIKYFENKYKGFEFFGVGWNTNKFQSYKGKINNKYEVLKNYKFTLCFENECNINGLISEKIFDCFYARTIPIFWGGSNPEAYFPKETYIDKRDFSSYDELDSYLNSITEKEYYKRIDAIDKYLISEEFKSFSSDNFSVNIYNKLMSDSIKETSFFKYYLKLYFIKSIDNVFFKIKRIVKYIINIRR